MLHSIRSLRSVTSLALLLPLAALVACSDGAESAIDEKSDAAASESGSDTGSNGADSEPSVDTAPPVKDLTAPTVESNDPPAGATSVSAAIDLQVVFDERMSAATINASSFTLKQGATPVAGTVKSDGQRATFQPTADLALGTTYAATISVAATDLAGNALVKEHTWSFTTDAVAPLGPKPVSLGSAGAFVILAKAAISNVPTSKITGDIGISPAAATYLTGFDLTRAGTRWTSPQVTGSLFAANNDPPTPTNLTVAIGAMQTAYTDAAGRPTPTALNLGAGTIGGLTFAPGLYKWTSTVQIPTDITFSGRANDVWIFQISGDMKLAAAKNMTLMGGARAKNIFFQVAGNVELGTTAHAEGIVLSQTAIKLGTGASINGRLFAQTAVTLAGNVVTAPSP